MESLDSSGEANLGFFEIETATESLSKSDIFHVVKEVVGFILYMHQQIPTVLQHLEHEFETLKKDYKQSEVLQIEGKEKKAYLHRKASMRKTEVKSNIKRLEKLMNSLSTLFSALREAVDRIPDFHGVALLLGGSLVRPYHVYEIFFSRFSVNSNSLQDSVRSKAGEALARKAVRALISKEAGGSSLSGPSKLFLLIKSHSNFNSPSHFLPKRDFRYNRKVSMSFNIWCRMSSVTFHFLQVQPIQLHIMSKIGDQAINDLHSSEAKVNSDSSTDMIWYQCRHVVKGIALKSQETEC